MKRVFGPLPNAKYTRSPSSSTPFLVLNVRFPSTTSAGSSESLRMTVTLGVLSLMSLSAVVLVLGLFAASSRSVCGREGGETVGVAFEIRGYLHLGQAQITSLRKEV